MKGVPDAPQCGFSRKVVNILRQFKVKFNHFNIFDDLVLKEELKVFAEWPTFPQLWLEGELQGGSSIVEEMVEDQEFEETFAKYVVK
jgi:Grx4 family monothiol glutaredoxin